MESLTFNEGTHFKVRKALLRSGLTEEQVTDAINEMQNEGILFRERGGSVYNDMSRPVINVEFRSDAAIAEAVREELVELARRHPRGGLM